MSGNKFKLIPYLGQLLRVGDHVSVEAWIGPQLILASAQADQFIYGGAFAYGISGNEVGLPLTQAVTLVFELDGQAPWSGHGRDALFGVAGFNWQLRSCGELHRRFNIGYQFPIERGARDELHWGIITQVFLDLCM